MKPGIRLEVKGRKDQYFHPPACSYENGLPTYMLSQLLYKWGRLSQNLRKRGEFIFHEDHSICTVLAIEKHAGENFQ
jgi:hypothetical protein